MISVIFFLLLSSQSANANMTVACGANSLTYLNDFMWKVTENAEHPFASSCEPFDYESGEYLCAESNLEDYPKKNYSIYSTKLPNNTWGGKPVKTLFRDVALKVYNRIQDERKKINDVKSCLQKKSPTECLPVNERMRSTLGVPEGVSYGLNDLILDARFNLYLSHPQNPIFRMNKSVYMANEMLVNNGIHKAKSWKSMTRDELVDARATFETYSKDSAQCAQSQIDARKAYDNDPKIQQRYKQAYAERLERERLEAKKTNSRVALGCGSPAPLSKFGSAIYNEVADIFIYDEGHMGVPNGNNFKFSALAGDCLADQRYKHTAAYTTILATNPILQFIDGPNPTRADAIKATDEMLAALKKEEDLLTENLQSINRKDEDPDSGLLRLLDYRTEMEEVLANRPEYCGISRDFVNLKEAKGAGKDAAIILPIMVASAFVPPAALAFGNVAVFGALAIHDQKALDESKFKVYGRFNPESEAELQDASMKEFNRNLSVFFAVSGIPAAARESFAIRNQRSMASKLKAEQDFFNRNYGKPYIDGEYSVISRKQRGSPRRTTPPPKP